MDNFDPATTGLIIVDMQNDFIHPLGAYGRAGQGCDMIAALPERLAPVANALRKAGGLIISTQFTLVPGRDDEPLIANHLKTLRPFLTKGDFKPGGFGHALIDDLQPADFCVEKVAFLAFFNSRLDWVLTKTGIKTLIFCGIVTNGGVASTLRDAHVREYSCIILSDGCGAFSAPAHDSSIGSLSTIATVATCAEIIQQLDV